MQRRLRLAVLAVLAFVASAAGISSASPVPKGPQVPVVGGYFQFLSGSWASYVVHHKDSGNYTLLDIAVGRAESCQWPGGCSWMELRMTTDAGEQAVVRMLTEKTKDGPGRIEKMAVQIEGHKPFFVPAGLLGQEDQGTPGFRKSPAMRLTGSRTGRIRGKVLSVDRVVSGRNGAESVAFLSRQVPPLGLVMLEDENIGIYLKDWGFRRGSWMTREPVSFYWWIMEQVVEALGEGEGQQ